MNLPFAVIVVAFTVGLPLWVIFRLPEGDAPDASPARELPHEQTSASISDGERAARDSRRRAA